MFLGIEVTLVDVLMGGGLGLVFLVLFSSYLHERKERREAKDATAAWIRLSDDQYESARGVRDDLQESYNEQEVLRTQLEEADEALDLACEDLANAEEEIEELEEESDGFEESATEAFEQLTIANDLVKHTLAWSERVLDVLERSEEERQ